LGVPRHQPCGASNRVGQPRHRQREGALDLRPVRLVLEVVDHERVDRQRADTPALDVRHFAPPVFAEGSLGWRDAVGQSGREPVVRRKRRGQNMAPRPEVAKWGLTRRQGWRHSRVKWPRSDGDPTGSDSRLATRRPPLSPPSGMPTLIPALRTSFEFRATRRRARRGSRSFSVWPAGALPEPAPTLTPNWTATSAAATTDLALGFGVKDRADVD